MAQWIRRRLAGEFVTYDPPAEAVQQIEHFLESLPLETTDLGTIGPRLVRLVHALKPYRAAAVRDGTAAAIIQASHKGGL